MTVNVHVKKLGKRGGVVAKCPYELPRQPHSLRELLTFMASSGAADYNRRLKQQSGEKLLTQEDILDMSHVGKVAFGIPFGSREADIPQAVETAIQGFADGLYRFFVNDREITGLDEPLTLEENDNITVIRLVMLTGGFF